MIKFKLPVSIPFIIAILALAIAIASCGIQLERRGQDAGPGPTAADTSARPDNDPQEFNKVFEVWNILEQQHFQRESLGTTELTDGAVRGMLKALDDPYALYLTPQQFSLDSEDVRGYFDGIGAQVTMRDGAITVVAPLLDTPAERAGLRPGDIILEIDGESTEGIGLLEAVSKIRGVKGESVDLLILRKTGGDPILLTIVRDVIKVESANLRMLVGRIAHVRIITFAENTEQEVVKILKKAKELGARGIILDVRNNPGGLLESVVDVTSHFLSDGLVLYEVDGRGNRKDWRVRSGGLGRDIPLVVLVNEGSASGSEVLAGALLDNMPDTVIGAKTFGKGSVSTLKALKDGSGLYFTIARWYTPKGNQIEGEGVEPQIVVAQPEDGSEDLQLDKAIEVLEAKVRALE